jgi:cytochrome c-type biogenesis protein CcmF
MSDLGFMAIVLGLAVALYSAAGSAAGRIVGAPDLVVSARRAAYLTAPIALAGAGALIAAFAAHDFSIGYVFAHSNRVMDREFIWVAFYAGNEGSLLYVTSVVSIMAAVAIRLAQRRLADSLPYTTAVLMAIVAFFFLVMVVWANPFSDTLCPGPGLSQVACVPDDGQGINPLLTHPGMWVHPPLLMAGLAGIAVPFAYAAGALIAGRTRDEWADAARVSGIVSWAILGSGILIGAWWAYTILGWGGYWGWDPIENVALMPWLAMTAFIHSIMVQKRRGMFRMWNIVLLNIAFVLAQFGMFINRGGPVVSVHSFAASTLGQVFLGFMLLSLVFAFGVFFWRYRWLKSDRPIESFLSREVAFLVNNFLLLGITFVTLWGVVFPLITEFASDGTVTVATPYFNRVNGPLFLALLAVMGIGPVMAWRRSAVRSLWRWLVVPGAVAVVAAAGMVAAGMREPLAIVAFSVLAFVVLVVLEEWFRSTRARAGSRINWATAWLRVVAGNRPRHGGYIVHLAIVTLAFGVVGTQFFDQRADLVLRRGESGTVGAYRLEYASLETETRSDRTAQLAHIEVYRGNDRVTTLRAWHAYYPDFRQASVRAGIRSTPVEDLYVVPTDFLEDGRLVLRASVNPLAMWLWIAGPIFVIGTVVAVWPQPVLEVRPAGAAIAANPIPSSAPARPAPGAA